MLNKYYLRRGIMLVGILLILICTTTKINAAIHNSFSVKPVFPDNQIDANARYFDLKVSPNHHQKLQLQISNSGVEVMDAKIEIFNATTADNGSVLYSTLSKKDKSLKKGVADYLTLTNNIITIEPNATALVELDLNIADEYFNGVVLGGISVTATNDKETESKGNMQIDNQIANVFGIMLSMDEINNAVPNLNLIKVYPKVSSFKAVVAANIQSDQPILMGGVKITGEIYRKNSKKVISKLELDDVSIAPNTNFNVLYEWNDKKIAMGDYRIKMKATHKDKIWEWDEEFNVGKEVAKVNKEAILSKENKSLLTPIVLGLCLLLLIILIIILIKRKKKNKDTK